MSFEDKLDRLEQISDALRKGNVSLENATAMFEEGMKLAKTLEKELAKVERKVEILVNEPQQEGEKPILELFPELQTDS